MSLLVALAIALLAAAAIVTGAVVIAQLLDGATSITGAVRCAARGRHEPIKHPLRGFRCKSCGKPGADLSDFNVPGGVQADGYVNPLQRTFTREHGGAVERKPW